MDATTRTLVSRAQGSDQDAIAELFDRHRARLRRAIQKLLGPSYRALLLDSEDAVSEGILAALRNLEKFEYRGQGSFLAWLLRCCANEVGRRVRAAAAHKRQLHKVQHLDETGTAEPTVLAPTPAEEAQGQELEEQVRRCLEQLLPQEQEVILLSWYLELDAEAIRQEMDLPSAGAARALRTRARARLTELLAKGGGPGLMP
jgi:RNA polymerase sigma-70 factor (ECF subfamily)